MHILVINFNAETTPDQFNDLVKEDAPIFAAIDGLIQKISFLIMKRKLMAVSTCSKARVRSMPIWIAIFTNQ